MSDTPQDTRPLRIAIDGVDDAAAVLTSFSGSEGVSRLYAYSCGLAVPVQAPLGFDAVLGKPAVVSVQQVDGGVRHVHGVISRVSQGGRDERFAAYTAELVPPLWLLTLTKRSRIFQHETTEDIVRKVVGGLYDLGAAFKLDATYHPRNITAQYHETDFAFLSRLLEEEGIYYYFTHTAGEHGIVFSDNPRGHRPAADDPFKYQAVGDRHTADGRVTGWLKAQELRTGTFTLTDHTFEMPGNRLMAVELPTAAVRAGTVTHQLLTGVKGDSPAVTLHPGGYARWRDGVGPGGADRGADLDPLPDEAARITKARAEADLAGTVVVQAESTYVQATAGHTFALADHFDADGEYLLTGVSHRATCGAASSGGDDFSYANTFTCVPAGVAFRPPEDTPRPHIRGTQTALVVGQEGAEIDPDKYGRVKVWFRWDPEGPRGLDTSCWVRVAQFWAGRQWGAQFLPRIDDEVVVSFLDGDPDRPLIIGSVYNADNMPMYDLPANKTQSGIKTTSSPGGGGGNYNELKFEDKKGQELVSIHAEKDMSVTVEDNYTVSIGADQKDPKKGGTNTTTTYGDTKFTVTKGDYAFTVAAGKAEYTVEGLVKETFNTTQTTVVNKEIDVSSTTSSIHLSSPTEILLTVKDSFVRITPDTITLHASKIHFEGGVAITGKATLVKFEGTDKFEAAAPHVTVDGKTDAMFQSSAGKADFAASSKATLSGSKTETVVCGEGKVAVKGTAINATADGTHEIVGSLVKIN